MARRRRLRHVTGDPLNQHTSERDRKLEAAREQRQIRPAAVSVKNEKVDLR
jgi:hypothetical protein